MTVKLTTKWKTIATVGYRPIKTTIANQNRAAHGAVCHCQAMRSHGVMMGRYVNSNGRHRETGIAFPLDAEMLENWLKIEKSEK